MPAIPTGAQTYDANDRLTTDNYDPAGNTVSSGGIVNSYDFENHLVQHGAVTVVYDGDGNRVSKTAAGVTTKYLVSDVNPTGYAQVVDELQAGVVVRRYSYGLEMISETQKIAGVFQSSFYSYDGHGSVRQLTNTAGTVTDAYTYDAFGNLIEQTGTTPNLYLYAGQQFDPDLGLYYNRARYLDVRNGRFWGMDPYEGNPSDPSSLHRYLYASDSPSTRIDPSGMDDLAEFNAASAMNQTIQAIAIQSYRGAVTGAIFGCVAGYLDNGDCASGASNGALWGAALGPLGGAALGSQAGRVLMILASAGLGGFGAYRAFQRKNYGLAAFYTITALGSALIISLIGSGPSANAETPPATPPPAEEAQPITNPSQLLGGAGPGFVQPWKGPIVEMTLQQDVVAYQVAPTAGQTGSPWFFAVRPATTAEAIGLGSLPPSNTAAFTTQVTIPAGTQIYVGIADNAFAPYGGGMQIYVPGGLPPTAYGSPTPTAIGLLPGGVH